MCKVGSSEIIINPRRACAARVTVVVLCVSMTIFALLATRRLLSDTNNFSGTGATILKWQFS